MLEMRIRNLDDASAERLLMDVVGHGERMPWSSELAEAFHRVVDPNPCAASVSKADLARAALLVLSSDPWYREEITERLRAPAVECFDFVTATAVLSAAVFVLKSYVALRPGQDGKYRFEFESQPLPIDAIRDLVEKLFGLASVVKVDG